MTTRRGSGFYVEPYNIGHLYEPLVYPSNLTPYEKGEWRKAWISGHCGREIEDIKSLADI